MPCCRCVAVGSTGNAYDGSVAIRWGAAMFEIERKFLVVTTAFLDGLSGVRLRQGYLARGEYATVRVREGGGSAWLTIKGRSQGISRPELEYEMPVADACFCLAHLCGAGLIDKTRYSIAHAGKSWEVDVFHGDNEGLVVAEIELGREDEPFERPPWLGSEVSADRRYYNASLAMHPYSEWKTN